MKSINGLHDGVTGVVLAGGKSSRMGTNKALLPVASIGIATKSFFSGANQEAVLDEVLLSRIVNQLSRFFSNVVVVAKHSHSYQSYGINAIGDLYPGCGPMAGLLTALSFVQTPYVFLTACDMPFIHDSLISLLLQYLPKVWDQAPDFEAIVPEIKGRREPLLALYHRNCTATALQLVEHERLCFSDLLDQIRVRYISEAELYQADPEFYSFFNMNTPLDLEDAKRIVKRKTDRYP